MDMSVSVDFIGFFEKKVVFIDNSLKITNV